MPLEASGFVSRRRFMAGALGALSGAALGQEEARIEGPLKFVLPFGPGSGTDIYARIIGQQLGGALGLSVIIDNRPGANGVLAAEFVAHAKPDGGTLLFTTNTTQAANPYLVKNLRYDPVKDFSPITKMGNASFFVLVNGDSPYHTLQALAAAGRAAPKSVSYGAANSLGMVSGTKLGHAASAEFLQVPYKSSPQIITDLIGGQIQFAFVDLTAAAPLIKSGKVRALAVLAEKRFSTMPEVPTMAEAGFPNFDIVAWYGLFAPARTPAAIVNRLNQAMASILAKPEIRDRGAELGIDVFGSSPLELENYVKSQLVLWRRLTADAGLKPE
jgi:tripartite-type tricarboxylate transporter receptor subunit TctC